MPEQEVDNSMHKILPWNKRLGQDQARLSQQQAAFVHNVSQRTSRLLSSTSTCGTNES